MVPIVEKDGAVSFRVHIQPRASRSELAGEHGEAIKLRIAAPPVDGKANEECCRLLGRLLEVSPSRVEIVAGAQSKDKVIRVRNLGAESVRAMLDPPAARRR